MKKNIFSLLLFSFVYTTIMAQDANEEFLLFPTESGTIYGTLLLPHTADKTPLVFIIAGSGPTDRDGNNPVMKNNSLKLLAEALAENGIASLRYDKRGVGESQSALVEEENLRFETYAEDAARWIASLNNPKEEKRFSKIIILGHSEGSLLGMLAAQKAGADAFISVAGPGQSADKTLKEQLSAQPKLVQDMSFPIIDSLVAGKTVDNVNPILASLFRPSVQPYLISWFQYDPQEEIQKLEMPVLIVQGTTDIQVTPADAEFLHQAHKQSQLALIDGMNHVFKLADADRQTNIATYSNPDLPIAEDFVKKVVEFIQSLQKN